MFSNQPHSDVCFDQIIYSAQIIYFKQTTFFSLLQGNVGAEWLSVVCATWSHLGAETILPSAPPKNFFDKVISVSYLNSEPSSLLSLLVCF